MKYNSKLGLFHVSCYQLAHSGCFKAIAQIPHSFTQYGKSQENFWGQNSCLQYPASGSQDVWSKKERLELKTGEKYVHETSRVTRRPCQHWTHIGNTVGMPICYDRWKQGGKVSLVLNNHHTNNMFVEVKALLQAFLTSALNSGEWSSSRFGRPTPCKTAPIAYWTQSRRVLCRVVFLKLCETADR